MVNAFLLLKIVIESMNKKKLFFASDICCLLKRSTLHQFEPFIVFFEA
jgi:hypothetical protein